MPSNIIGINHSKNLEWIMPDSSMNILITILDVYGDRDKANKYPKTISSDTSASLYLQSDCQLSR